MLMDTATGLSACTDTCRHRSLLTAVFESETVMQRISSDYIRWSQAELPVFGHSTFKLSGRQNAARQEAALNRQGLDLKW